VKLTAVPNAVQPDSFPSSLFKVAGLVLLALAVMMLLGLTDDFPRIDHLANGRWALKHAVRGAVATFTRDELASIEAVESRTSTRDPAIGLPPGKVHIRRPYGRNWTNGASGITLKDCVGTYQYVNQHSASAAQWSSGV
jgi:hypothetical protein